MDRLILYMEDGLTYDSGVWFQRSCGDKTLHLFVKGEGCPSFLGKLIKKYLTLWAEVYR